MKMLALTIMSLCAISALVAGLAEAQITCTQIGQFLSCDGPRNSNTTQLNLGNGQGVITDSQGNVEPYAIFPTQPTRRSVVPAPQAPRALASPFIQPIQPIDPIGQPLFITPGVGGVGDFSGGISLGGE